MVSHEDERPTAGHREPFAPRSPAAAERLRELSSPPWRVVFEIGPKLGAIDHVVIGPTDVIAMETLVLDRPDQAPAVTGAEPDPGVVAAAAIARDDVDDLTRTVGVPCQLLAKVYWGSLARIALLARSSPPARSPSQANVSNRG